MGKKNETREIAGLKITVSQFAPMRAYRFLALAAKTLGPVLSTIVPALSLNATSSLRDMSASTIGNAFAMLDESAAERLLLELFSNSSVVADVNGKPVKFDLSGRTEIDVAFGDGGLAALFAAAKFALEVNFADFIKGLASAPAGTSAPDDPA